MTDVQEKYSQVENVTKQALAQGYVPDSLKWKAKMPEDLAARTESWYQNIEENLSIDIDNVRSEFEDSSLIKVEPYSSNSPKWDMFLSRDKNQHIKVYSKKCWTDVPGTEHMKPFYEARFYPFLLNNTNPLLPKVLYNTENFVGVEWMNPDDGWRFATVRDFAYTGSNNIKLNQPVITSLFKNVIRDFQALYESAADKFSSMRVANIKVWKQNTEYFNDLYVNLENYITRNDINLSTDKNTWKKSDFKMTIQPSSLWIRDFVVSSDGKHCKYIDVENLRMWDVTRLGLWYHKYRLQTDLGDETNEKQWVSHTYSDPGVEHDNTIADETRISYSIYIDEWFHQSIPK